MSKDCIIWQGHKWSQGRYGKDTLQGKSIGAHRAAWIRVNGPIPKGLVICHRCDNGLCVNVEHMFLGTLKDNMQDCIRKGRHRANQNQKGANNNNARPDYLEIKKASKELRAEGLTLREIRNKLNIKSNGHLINLIRS